VNVEESDGEDAMTGSIICGVDDSESAKGAARVARELGSKLGLRLVFVRVVEAGTADDKISAIAQRLQHLTNAGTEADCGAGWLVEVGHPADRLVAAAEDEDASMIVVGSTGVRSPLLGSISAEVSRRAPCPVVVVPHVVDVVGQSRDDDSGHGKTQFAGGIARFGLGSSADGRETDFAGGIVRFNFGSRAD
jgi:nucleotide-binding universal stress UspA family protein